MNYQDIPGWFSSEPVYDFLLKSIPRGGVFVECGAWLGKSSNYLCNQRSDIRVVIVDHWLGSQGEITTNHKLAQETDIFQMFKQNMEGLRYEAIRKSSREASLDFEDGSLDVVFIDMGHTYEDVKEDIGLWLPKVKSGGILAGDDYTLDWPSVIQAVQEYIQPLTVMGRCWLRNKKR